ncbi:hypothetical protein L1999_01745 [Neobacillus drentensis]|uniref:hypothetical protein n=1 Tax=Neobacillus drentensis TaxID=220684 RepID=UPI001F1AD169|nr:hypothetical protein [Neobacillus drentensis]ULT57362.1 hypothetical protein L1999_01745 [Neobacillus drentensis]
MVDKLTWDQNKISWYFEHEINKSIDNIILAMAKKDKEIIYVEAGPNFITEKVYSFLYNGDLLFSYDKTLGVIEWNHNGKVQKKAIGNLKQASYYPNEKRILVLINKKSQDIVIGLDIHGDVVFEIKSPAGYSMEYFTEINDSPVVVCEGDENHVDSFGRGRVNFFIDLTNAKLEKGNLAY